VDAFAGSAGGTASSYPSLKGFPSKRANMRFLSFKDLLDARNLLNHGVRSAELHRLVRNLLGVVPVETTPQRSRDGHNGDRSEETL